MPYVTFAYNSSCYNTTGFSPFYLLFGRHTTLLFESFLPSAADTPTEYTRDTAARARTTRQIARNRLSASQISQKACYYSHHRTVHFSSGSLVRPWTSSCHVGLSSKFLTSCSGPYNVLRWMVARRRPNHLVISFTSPVRGPSPSSTMTLSFPKHRDGAPTSKGHILFPYI